MRTGMSSEVGDGVWCWYSHEIGRGRLRGGICVDGAEVSASMLVKLTSSVSARIRLNGSSADLQLAEQY